MDRIAFDVLRLITEKNIQEISEELLESIDLIKEKYTFLLNNNYINNDNSLTNKGTAMLESHKVDNAIILAAGMSTRFVPICYETPKGLLPVKGTSLVERQIIQLREKGIEEIIIVVGYMKEMFNYLVDKYGVILVESKEYQYKNNHSSVYAAREYLKNSIITSSDLYFTDNIFQKYAYDSYYTTVYMKGHTEERGVEVEEDGRITDTFYGERAHDVWVTFGHAFFTKRFSTKMIEILEQEYDDPKTYNKFWADIQDEHLEDLYMYQKKCKDGVINEFDSLEELRLFDEKYKYNSGSNILERISKLLNTTEDKLSDFEMLKTIRNELFKFKNSDLIYLCDIKEEEKEIEYNNETYSLKYKDGKIKIYERRIR